MGWDALILHHAFGLLGPASGSRPPGDRQSRHALSFSRLVATANVGQDPCTKCTLPDLSISRSLITSSILIRTCDTFGSAVEASSVELMQYTTVSILKACVMKS